MYIFPIIWLYAIFYAICLPVSNLLFGYNDKISVKGVAVIAGVIDFVIVGGLTVCMILDHPGSKIMGF